MRIKDRMLRLLDETTSVSGRMRSLLEKTTLPVGTRHKWSDGKVWVKQRDGSWAPEVARLPPPPAAKPTAQKAATAASLPDDPYKYFHKTADSKLIPLSALRTIRARPEGIKNAATHMANAYNGAGAKRKPLSVQDNGDGTYTVLDGNSTTAMARQQGWKNIVAVVEPAAEKSSASSNAAIAATVKQGDESLATAVEGGKLAKGVSAEEHVQIAKDFLTKHSKSLDASTKALKDLMPEGCKVKSRVKELNSALGKLLRKPKYQRADNLQDATGMRVIAPDAATLDKAVEALKKNYKVVEMDDYTKDPLGGEDGLGYRSFHAIIEDKDGLLKEVQLRTPGQDKHADWCHDVYKPRTPQQQEGLSKYATVIADYARKMGKYFAAVDSKKQADPPECPTPVQKFFTCL